MVQVLVVAGVAVAAGAVAVWRWCATGSRPATTGPGSAVPHAPNLGQPRPAQEVEGNQERGIYAWYADRDGRAALSKAGIAVRDDGLIYIGSATKNFDYRIVRCHLRGTVRNHPPGTRGYGSTLRRSLAGVLFETTGRASERQVTDFMNAHLQVALKPMRPADIRREESRLIQKYEPALNIKGLSNDNAESLHRMRRTVRECVPALFNGEDA